MLRFFKHPKRPNEIAIAMVALNESSFPTPNEFQQYLEQNFLDLPRPIHVDIKEKENQNALTVEMGNTEGVALMMPIPIPWSDLEGPCSTAWWWPEAEEKLKEHKFHAIVTLIKHPEDIIRNYLLVTKLTSCLVATTNCVGVYWGSGTIVHPPDIFIEYSKNSSDNELPLNLWIDFRVQQLSDGQFQLLTTGLDSLNKKEIEIAPCHLSPKDLLELGYDIAYYVLKSEAEIRSGHTFGRSTSEKIRIRFTKSIWDKSKEVMRFEIPE